MSSPPSVTVLMGVFNGLPHLERSVQSILQQTFADFELLVIDDASTDGSGNLLERYSQIDGRVRFIRNEANLGLGQVLNRGVNEARGSLIARMDADDVAVSHRLQRQVDFFRKHPELDIVGSFAQEVDSRDSPIRERRVPVSHDDIARLVWTNPFIHTSVMFKRTSILGVGSYSAVLRRRQDYDLWFRCVAHGLRFANIPEPLVHYRFTDETMKRNHIASMWGQTRIGLQGCRLVRAPMHAYVATCMPLVETILPRWLRRRLTSLRSKFDPRS